MVRLSSLLALAAVIPCALAQRPVFAPVHETLPFDVVQVEAFALGDLDGDGDLDAVAGKGGDDRVWLNDGLGVFTDVSATHWPGDSSTAQDLALGDLDGDGDPDLVVAELGGPLHVYANDGSGRFTNRTATWLGSTPRFPTALGLEDLDGDRDLDLLVGHGAGLPDQLYLNDGTGRLANVTSTHLPADVAVTFAVALGDVDGDGDPDALLGHLSGAARLYRNDGSAHFTDVTSGNLPPDTGTRSIELGDVDGDFDLDVVLGTGGSNRCYVNDGTGSFTDETGTRFPIRVGGTWDLALVDFDGDGDRDLLIVAFTDPSALWVNDGGGVFAALSGALPDDPGAVAVGAETGDVDGDGDVDVLVADVHDFSELWLNDGSAQFVDATVGAIDEPLNGEQFGVVIEDLDGDGDRDLFVAQGHPFSLQGNLVLLLGDDGRYVDVSATALPPTSFASQGIAAGDLDGDGDIDVLVGNAGGQQNELLLNSGAAVFTDVSATHLPVLADETYEVALGDVDGDGDLDAWIGNWRQPDGLLLNDGSAGFRDASANLPPHNGLTTGIGLGDLDGDGDLDALVVFAGEQNRLYRNDGTGRYTDVTGGRLPMAQDGSQHVALGDVDGDGDLDAWVANQVHADVLLLNNGSGTFFAAPVSSLPAFPLDSRSVVFADVDVDGDLDAVVATAGEGSRVAFNDGSGRFIAGALGWAASYPERIEVADVDGDGDPDLVEVAPLTFLPNHRRHLQWRGLPRVGKPLRLSVEGPVNDVFVLNVGLAPAWLPTPFGVLRLDPALLLATGGGLLDPQGRGTFTLLVPNLPALIGFTLYWQGIVGWPDFGPTNLEPTRFTGA